MVWFFLIIILVIILVFIFYAYRYEPTNFKLSEVNIYIKNNGSIDLAPKKINSPVLTILHLSDFHLRKNYKGRKLYKFVKSLNNLEPDFIFLTGDLVEQDKNIEYLAGMLNSFKARYGKYAVFGVHDYYNKKLAEFLKNMFKRKREYERENDVSCIVSRLADIGIEVLSNEARKINIGRQGIREVEIIGLDDPIIKKIDIEKAFKDTGPVISPELLKKSNYEARYRNAFSLKKEKVHKINNKDKLRLILMHTPDADSITELSQRKVDIIFSGHTHGGQVRLPLIGAVLSGCRIKTKFASGLFYFKNFVLYITRGLGEGRFSQFRFYCQPEASLVRIYKTN